jgi:hypothetical protein
MKIQRPLFCALLATLGAPFAFSLPILYNFDVNGVQVGSFTYDPATEALSSFVVNIDGALTNFSSGPEFNHIGALQPCGTGSSGAIEFALLEQACVSGASYEIQPVNQAGYEELLITTLGPSGYGREFLVSNVSTIQAPNQSVDGQFTGTYSISQAVPEPASIGLALCALVIIALSCRGRRAQGT